MTSRYDRRAVLRCAAGLLSAVAAGGVAGASGGGGTASSESATGPGGRPRQGEPAARVGPGAGGYRLDWATAVSNAGYETVNAVAPTPDRGAVAVGMTNDGGQRPWLVGVDPDGDPRFSTVPDVEGKLFGVHVRADGSALAAGSTESPDPGPDALLLAVDAEGTVTDRWTYGDDSGDDANAVVPLGDRFALLGRTISYGADGTSAYVQVVDGDGAAGPRTTWVSPSGSADVTDGVGLPGGDAVVAGRWQPDDADVDAIAVARLAPDGSRRWLEPLTGERDRNAPVVATAGDDRLMVGLNERLDTTTRPLVLGLGRDGTLEWTLRDLGGDVSISDVADAGDGDCWVVGTDGGRPAHVAKVSPGGDLRWARQFDGGTEGIVNTGATAGRGLLVGGRFSDDGIDGFVDRVALDNEPPEPSVTFSPRAPRPGETVTFDASGSTDPDGEVVAHEWDLTDDGTVDATGPEATHEYDTAGDRAVTLRVVDDVGVERTTTVDVSVGTPTESEAVGVPGFGAGAAVVGLGGAALELFRRRR